MSAEADGLRIGFLSDLHCDSEAALARTERAASLLASRGPDVVLLGGDFVTSHGEQWAEPCADALLPLSATPQGVYAVLGNHDWWTDSAERVTRELRRVGFWVLRNESARLRYKSRVYVVGLDSVLVGNDDLSAAMQYVPEAAAKLLLVHEPDYAGRAPAGFVGQFSGHSHGGQVRIPLLPPLRVPEAENYVYGLYRTPRHPLYVTAGVGTIGPPVRFRCPPEVALLTLSPA
jgi:predicted MPP superfamily phosphohydrolase